MPSFKTFLAASAALMSTAFASTDFDASANNNVAVYWVRYLSY